MVAAGRAGAASSADAARSDEPAQSTTAPAGNAAPITTSPVVAHATKATVTPPVAVVAPIPQAACSEGVAAVVMPGTDLAAVAVTPPTDQAAATVMPGTDLAAVAVTPATDQAAAAVVRGGDPAPAALATQPTVAIHTASLETGETAPAPKLVATADSHVPEQAPTVATTTPGGATPAAAEVMPAQPTPVVVSLSEEASAPIAAHAAPAPNINDGIAAARREGTASRVVRVADYKEMLTLSELHAILGPEIIECGTFAPYSPTSLREQRVAQANAQLKSTSQSFFPSGFDASWLALGETNARIASVWVSPSCNFS